MRLSYTPIFAVVLLLFHCHVSVPSSEHKGIEGVGDQMLPSKDQGKLLPSQSNRPVWWHGPFFSDTGYGFEAELLFKEVIETVRLTLFQWGAKESLQVIATMSRSVRNQVFALLGLDTVEPEQNAIIICHQQPDFWAVPRPPPVPGIFCPPIPSQDVAYVIGRSLLSAERLEAEHVHICNLMHEIWLPSDVSTEAYRKAGVVRPQLLAIPGVVDTDDIFNPDLHSPLELPIGKLIFGSERFAPGLPFVFLSVFDWHERDGWDVLLRAYLEEFGVNASTGGELPDVVLVMVTEAKVINKYGKAVDIPDEVLIQQIRKWAFDHHLVSTKSGLGALARVYLLQKHLLDPHLADLLKTANVFVHPTRGGAFERRHVASMSMGVPVIATNWGEATVLLDESTGYPVDVERFTPVPEELAVYDGQVWPQPSVLHLRQLMRHVVEAREDVVARGRAARARVLERHSPHVVGALIASRLAAIDKQINIGNATLQWHSKQQLESLTATENQLDSDEF